eukprot:498605-Pleurochrysis_carterae.AAC.1
MHVLQVLRCVCFNCSKILGDEPPDETGQLSADARRIAAAARRKNPSHRCAAAFCVWGGCARAGVCARAGDTLARRRTTCGARRTERTSDPLASTVAATPALTYAQLCL